jgi:hypothetical protein
VLAAGSSGASDRGHVASYGGKADIWYPSRERRK